MNFDKSQKAFEQAKKYITGGVNSPVRAFASAGISPIFAQKAKGSKIWDIDNNQYIDYICSWGPFILGHSPEFYSEGVEQLISNGTSYGLPTEIEVEMAKEIVESYNGVDLVRMVNSGTEATMSALRVARGFTGKNKIVKFEGCYHGHSDGLLVSSGSGTLTYGNPTSLGVPDYVVRDTLVSRYNDINMIEKLFEQNKDDIACIIVEPISGNMGVVPAKKEFLQKLRELCDKYNSLLIFDEVITGFRLAYGSASEYFGIVPDMACFGKIIGGGLPVGAYGGRRDIMEIVSPLGGVYQAGTLSGNPLAMFMGLKNLKHLKNNKNIYDNLNSKAIKLEDGIKSILKKLGLNYTVNRGGSLICLFFTNGAVNNYDDVKTCNIDAFNKYFKEMLNQGVLIAPTQFEAMFISNAHTDEDIEKTLCAIEISLKKSHNVI